LKAAEPTRCPDTSARQRTGLAAVVRTPTIGRMKRLIMLVVLLGLAAVAVKKLQDT
jgi:hypothetical protein